MKRLFLGAASSKHEMNSFQRKALGRLPAIVGRVGQRTGVPFKATRAFSSIGSVSLFATLTGSELSGV